MDVCRGDNQPRPRLPTPHPTSSYSSTSSSSKTLMRYFVINFLQRPPGNSASTHSLGYANTKTWKSQASQGQDSIPPPITHDHMSVQHCWITRRITALAKLWHRQKGGSHLVRLCFLLLIRVGGSFFFLEDQRVSPRLDSCASYRQRLRPPVAQCQGGK